MNKDDFIKMMEDGYKSLTREETLEEKSFRVGYEYAVDKMFYIVMNSDKEIERLNNIIKEVREFVEKWKYEDGDGTVFFDMNTNPDDLLKILDKGEDK